MNLSALNKKLDAIENILLSRQGGDSSELLSPRDVAVLLDERHRLGNEDGTEEAILVARIDEILRGHERAIKACCPPHLTAREATEALEATQERIEEGEEQYRHHWMDRLRTMT